MVKKNRQCRFKSSIYQGSAKKGSVAGCCINPRKNVQRIFAVFKELDNRDSAFTYSQLAKSLGDSLHNVQLVKTNQYQRLNLDNQISLQQKEKEKIQSENLNRTYALLGGIGVLLMIAFLLCRNASSRKKANTVLENTLAALNATQASLFARNAENE